MSTARRVRLRCAIGLAGLVVACARSRGGGALPAREILYQSQAPGGTEDLWALAPATRSARVLLRGDSATTRGLASWSPDGRRVAYVRESDDRDALYVFDAGTGTHRRLGDGLPAAVLFPDWSPDGRRLALSAGTTSRHVGVWLVDVATGRAREIRAGAASYRCPSWSPRGDRMVVAAYAAGRTALLALDTAGAVLDTLLASDTTYLDCPQWSPRGDEVLFTVFHGSGVTNWERPAFHSSLAVLSLGGSGVRRLTRSAGLTNYGRWSPDGQWVVFQSDRASPPTADPAGTGQMLQNLEIYIVRRDGTDMRRLTTNTHFDAHPAW